MRNPDPIQEVGDIAKSGYQFIVDGHELKVEKLLSSLNV
jgi:hypothetical protein